jgi:hypothetical protein
MLRILLEPGSKRIEELTRFDPLRSGLTFRGGRVGPLINLNLSKNP